MLPDWWFHTILEFAPMVVAVTLILTLGALWPTIQNFGINTDLTNMLSDDLPFRKFKQEFDRAFPALHKSMVVVIDADTPERATQLRDLVADGLRYHDEVFKDVYTPGGGPFFDRNGLLFQNLGELDAMSEHLAEIQPFLGLFVRDASLPNLLSIVATKYRQPDQSSEATWSMIRFVDCLSNAMNKAVDDEPIHFSWRDLVYGHEDDLMRLRRFVIAVPEMDYSKLFPAKTSIQMTRQVIEQVSHEQGEPVKIRLTGDVVLGQDDMKSLKRGIVKAVALSLSLVGLVLYIGLRSIRLVAVCVITLLVGLSWTFSFAIATFRELNMISIAFAVLFIGIGIDYCIQFCLRYQECIATPMETRRSIIQSARNLCNPFIVCTMTTAFGFLAFVPTAYQGASELGVISGMGMVFNFFATLTLLPALLVLMPPPTVHKPPTLVPYVATALSPKVLRAILATALVLGVCASILLPRVGFDSNPLNLSDPSSESVRTALELYDTSSTSPWSISVLANTSKEAAQLTDRLESLPEVHSAVDISSFVPANQSEKIARIDDMALFMPSIPDEFGYQPSAAVEIDAALQDLRLAITNSKCALSVHPSNDLASLQRLALRIDAFLSRSSNNYFSAAAALEKGILSGLVSYLDDLKISLRPVPFGEAELPLQIRERFVGRDGRYRIQVFPRDNLTDRAALEQFVHAVRSVSMEATSAPVVTYEAGRVIFRAFRRATFIAILLIAASLWIVFREISAVFMILLPLLLAFVITAASTVVFQSPLNFANIIVLPLLLGIGVDFGIHMLYRYREENTIGIHPLRTSTARGVFFSALTTMVSFGSLCIVSHRGTASMGQFLTLGIVMILGCTLIVLPSVLQFRKGRRIA